MLDHDHDDRPSAIDDPEGYIARQAEWHTDDVKHLLPLGPPTAFFLREWDRRVQATIRSAPPGRILDVGCGNARDICELARSGWVGCGIDPSGPQLLEADRMVGAYGATAWLVRAVGEALPFKDGAFSAVMCKSAIDHVVDRDTAMAEFARVTAPGGRIVVSAVNFGGLTCRVSRGIYGVSRLLRIGDRQKHRFWDTHVPHEHTFEGTHASMTGLMPASVSLEKVYGVSLLFGFPGWAKAMRGVPGRFADGVLNLLDRVARRAPRLADVIVCSWRKP